MIFKRQGPYWIFEENNVSLSPGDVIEYDFLVSKNGKWIYIPKTNWTVTDVVENFSTVNIPLVDFELFNPAITTPQPTASFLLQTLAPPTKTPFISPRNRNGDSFPPTSESPAILPFDGPITSPSPTMLSTGETYPFGQNTPSTNSSNQTAVDTTESQNEQQTPTLSYGTVQYGPFQLGTPQPIIPPTTSSVWPSTTLLPAILVTSVPENTQGVTTPEITPSFETNHK